MDVKFVNPFINAITTVLPQLGFITITRGKLSTREKAMPSLGVTVLVGFTKSVRGNVAYNMTKESACKIASTMMMGMPIVDFDEMAQSAISELSNMLTANVATNLASMDFEVDISTPSLTLGDGFSVKISDMPYLVIEMNIDGNLIEINMDLH